MAGIPHHAVDTYVGQLLAAGKKVAICDQQEAARPGRLVRRQLTRILTPGHDPGGEPARRRPQPLPGRPLPRRPRPSRGVARPLDRRIQDRHRLPGREPASGPRRPGPRRAPCGRGRGRALAGGAARPDRAARPAGLRGRAALHGAPGLPFRPGGRRRGGHGRPRGPQPARVRHRQRAIPALGPAGALVHYATENLCAKPENLRGLQEYRSARSLLLDPATLRNLEIFASSRGDREGSLARRHRPHGDGRRRPAARALACRAHPRAGGDPPAPAHWSASCSPSRPAWPSCASASRRSATSRASSAACRTACATRGSWAA